MTIKQSIQTFQNELQDTRTQLAETQKRLRDTRRVLQGILADRDHQFLFQVGQTVTIQDNLMDEKQPGWIISQRFRQFGDDLDDITNMYNLYQPGSDECRQEMEEDLAIEVVSKPKRKKPVKHTK
jgi:streptomycin 6-kinase